MGEGVLVQPSNCGTLGYVNSPGREIGILHNYHAGWYAIFIAGRLLLARNERSAEKWIVYERVIADRSINYWISNDSD